MVLKNYFAGAVQVILLLLAFSLIFIPVAAAQVEHTYSVKTVVLTERGEPGKILPIQVDLETTNSRPTSVLLKLELWNPSESNIIVSKEDNISLLFQASVVERLLLPEGLPAGDYVLKIFVYDSPRLTGEDPLASSSDSILIEKTISDNLADIVSFLTSPAIIQLIIVLLLILLLFSLLAYQHHRKREERRRYLESINFKSLPQPKKGNGYLGLIAESKVKAYMNFDSLLTHTVITGATGMGKTIASQIIVEEALDRGISVLVFDPTAQWTGLMRPNQESHMFTLYPKYDLKNPQAKAYEGTIKIIEEASEPISLKDYMQPGKITVFSIHRLTPQEIESFIVNTLEQVFKEELEEQKHVRALLVYDEIHRLLPKFGGSGKGFLAVERAVREFRKWGLGLVLISQVLTDFVGEIKANIGTEIQLRSGYEEDLDRVKTKYGDDTLKSVVKADVGIAMIQNAEYNEGRPYFISFRPTKHHPHRLTEEELERYLHYNGLVEELHKRLDEIKEKGVDVFDMELELGLAEENVKKGRFNIVDVYLESLSPQINEYYERTQKKEISEGELAIESEWDAKKAEALEGYEGEIGGLLKKQRMEIEKRENELQQRGQKGIEEIEQEMEEIINEKLELEDSLRAKKEELETEAPNLSPDELKTRKQELSEGEEQIRKSIEDKKRQIFIEESRLHDLLQSEREELEGLLRQTLSRWDEVQEDKRRMELSDQHLDKSEEELAETMAQNISTDIEKAIEENRRIKDEMKKLDKKPDFFSKLLFKKELTEEEKKERVAELSDAETRWKRMLGESRKKRIDDSRADRKRIKKEKDKLLSELQKIKGKWKDIISNEAKIRDKEENLLSRMTELKDRVNHERDTIKSERINILEGIETGKLPEVPDKAKAVRDQKLDEEFSRVEEEWKNLEKMVKEKNSLEVELVDIRGQLREHQKLRMEEEEKIRLKEEELEELERKEEQLKRGENELKKEKEDE
ncbi:helicase HerA-like domain-containing protein [Candidatus Altiarchaeota archaeon]